jgi:hypothetical protein
LGCCVPGCGFLHRIASPASQSRFLCHSLLCCRCQKTNLVARLIRKNDIRLFRRDKPRVVTSPVLNYAFGISAPRACDLWLATDYRQSEPATRNLCDEAMKSKANYGGRRWLAHSSSGHWVSPRTKTVEPRIGCGCEARQAPSGHTAHLCFVCQHKAQVRCIREI